MAKTRWIVIAGLVLLALVTGISLAAQGDLTAMQQRLNSQFKVTTLTLNGMDITDTGAGDVVVLNKDGLKMSALANPVMESSVYKDGKIGGGAAKRVWGNLGVAMIQGMAMAGDTTGTAVPVVFPSHVAAAGEKFWVVAITAERDGINFKLYTDADGNGVRYHANLKVLYPNKKQVPPVDEAMRLVAEVLSVVQQDNQGGQPAPEVAPAPVSEPAPAPMPAIAPPPPPPDAAPPTVALGQTQAQVIAGFGQPIKVKYVDGKTVFTYKDMKVTFTGGKVSDVE